MAPNNKAAELRIANARRHDERAFNIYICHACLVVDNSHTEATPLSVAPHGDTVSCMTNKYPPSQWSGSLYTKGLHDGAHLLDLVSRMAQHI